MKNKLPIAALVGAITGVVAGVLTAPKSGKETRKIVRNNTKIAENKAKRILGGVLHGSKKKALEIQKKAKERITR